MKIINCEQRTDEWFKCRELKMTASNAKTIIANGKGLDTYCKDLVTEYVSEIREETYTNEAMQRGILLEPIARQKANEIFGKEYQEIGLCEFNNRIAASPDGVIFDDKGNIIEIIEIKCPSNNRFMEQFMTDTPFEEYIAQIQMQLYVTGAKQCLYFVYNENIKPYYYAKIITIDAEIQDKLKKGLERGSELIDALLINYYSKIENLTN